MAAITSDQNHEIKRQVSQFLARNPTYHRLPYAEQAAMINDTARIVETMAAGPRAARSTDPYDLGLATFNSQNDPNAPAGQVVGDAKDLLKKIGKDEIGSVIGAGVTQAARMVKEINFPAFVANLIEGVFHAIVKSSIEQMKAYAEMVKSVSASLNDFKDQNTTDNQARDSLVNKYPRHLQIVVVDNRPRVAPRDDAPEDTPDYAKDYGLGEAIDDVDDEENEAKLVAAARDDLARGRQQLLATIILMGINRIIVTDGKINAKIKFQFSANEKRNTSATAYDYVNMGQKTTNEGEYESQYQGPQYQSQQGGGGWNYQGSNSYAKGNYTTTTEPDVRVTSEVDMSSDASIQASGQIMGDVSVNFKSETFPLEKMVNTDQMMRLQQAQGGPGAGRAAPAGPAPQQVPAQAAAPAATPAPAPTPR